MDRSALRSALERSRADLSNVLQQLSSDDLLEPGVVGEWSVRDVLQHLSIWEAETIQLIVHFRRGRRPPSERFDREVDDLNARWHAATRHRPLEQVLADFHAVRRQTLRQLDELTDDDLSRVRPFPWLEGRPLAQWIAEDTYRHEEEHTGQIRQWWKNRTAKRAGPPPQKDEPR